MWGNDSRGGPTSVDEAQITVDLTETHDGAEPSNVVVLPRVPLDGPGLMSGTGGAAKRIFDVLVATTILTLAAPAILGAIVALWFASRGPVLHRRIHLGCDRVPFAFVQLAPSGTRIDRAVHALRVNRLLGLLPVVTGHMSLVGPRPVRPEEAGVFRGRARRRLAVKPGWTGPWRLPEPGTLETAIESDLRYIEEWSLALDVGLLARSAVAVRSR